MFVSVGAVCIWPAKPYNGRANLLNQTAMTSVVTLRLAIAPLQLCNKIYASPTANRGLSLSESFQIMLTVSQKLLRLRLGILMGDCERYIDWYCTLSYRSYRSCQMVSYQLISKLCIDGSVQDCTISIVVSVYKQVISMAQCKTALCRLLNTLEILQSCTEPLVS